MKIGLLLPVITLVFLAGCGDSGQENKFTPPVVVPIPTLSYTVAAVYKHDTNSYTEGFLFHDHKLYESSGAEPDQPQLSMAGVEDMQTGKIDKKVELDKKKYFGEGIAFFGDRLYQLTYKNKTGFIYDAKTFQKLDTFRYQNTEGWALTTDSTSLIMSDGTSMLTYLDPKTLQPVRTLTVTMNGTALDSINELEYIKGCIYANRYTKNYIYKIDPRTGTVLARLDLTSLVAAEMVKNPNVDVLNGIAYDPDSDKIYVTGKLWSGIYQINFNH